MKNTLLFRASIVGFYCSSLFIFIIISLLWPETVLGQKYYTAEKSYAVKLGRTKPLYEMVSMQPTDSLKLKIRKANKPEYVANFGGRRHLDIHSPNALPQGPDPLFNPDQMRMPLYQILPTTVFEGISEASVNSGVPDVNGDIGLNYYVEIVNATHFKVYSKTGLPVSGLISANSIWSQVQQSSAGDPILLYDQTVDRWLLTEFPSNNRVLMAISLTGDPRGSWDAYAFQTPRFPDFPKYGIWPDAYFLSTNEGGPDFPIYAFNREDMLAGADIVRFQRLTVPKINGVFFEVGQPIDWDGLNYPPGNSPGLVVKLHDDDWFTTDHDHIILHKVTIDWDAASNSNIELIDIPTTPFDTDGCSLENTGGFSCVPQPNEQGIDGAQWIITNKAQYRNFGDHESFVMSFMVDVTGNDVAGIRWMEFRKTPLMDWHIYQEGTIGSDDGLHRFMSSIGIDGRGSIGIGYSISGYDKHPSLRYTGRYATDPPGIMTFEEYEFASGNGSLGSDRFGDYASMSVDPSDDKTFWFAGEYVISGGNWSTKIVSFEARRDTFDLFPVSLIAPQNSPTLGLDEPLTISVLNRGLNTVHDFSLGYKFTDGSWIEEAALVDSLPIDSIYIHTFSSGLDFDAPGHYPLLIASILDIDRNHLNDTLTFDIIKFAYRDVALEYEVPSSQSLVCSDSYENSIIIRNLGVDTITSITFQVTQDNIPIDTISWSGSLEFGEEEVFLFTSTGLITGPNQIVLTVLEINQDIDEIPSNNVIAWTLNANPDGYGLFLNLTTDNFPQETTWELTDESDNVIATGGPYAEQRTFYLTSICVDPEACYTFTIYDSYGDGMSAQGVQGNYEIVNNEGEVVASLSKPNFGDDDVNEFCLTGECVLELQVGIVHESMPGAGDAWVIGEVVNSLGVITYSIDGENFQENNTFLNVPPGTYTMIVEDDAGCSDSVTFIVLTCTLQTLVTTLPASGGDVGEIHISASGGIGPILYSLNGGTFVSDTFFMMLEPGVYFVQTKDSVGCERIDTVTVSTHVSTSYLKEDHFIQINPNPGHGVYQIEAVLHAKSIFIGYTVFAPNGEPVHSSSIVRYNDVYKGELSLIAFPPGVYYITFYLEKSLAVKRVIKSE